MTDTSLPNSQFAAANQPNSTPTPSSYVDSYAPPTPVATAAPDAPSAPPTAAPSTVPATSSTPTHDPLAELEKALQEYEARQKQLTQKTQETVQKTQTAVQSTPTEDPLAELERVLDEYEAKYKQQNANATPGAPSEPVKPEPMAAPPTTSSPTVAAPALTPPPPVSQKAEKESIEDQNIFELLGVADADTNEKEAFLDELQTALWEDFLDKDLALLVTADQLKEVQTLRSQATLPENERQEKLIQKVEFLVPDIEEIMLEKALELKEDMVRERLTGMKEYYASRPNDMTKIQQAEQHILAGQWRSGAQLLNTLTA